MTQPLCIATIDPGIDVTGVAFWRPEYAKETLYGAAYALMAVKSLRTDAQQSSAERCYSLFTQLQLALQSFPPVAAVIELPPAWHSKRERYGRRREGGGEGEARQSGAQKVAIMKLNRALGALAAAVGASGSRIYEVEASQLRQEKRYEHAIKACEHAGRALPKNDDERSAVWIGLEIISTGVWRDYAKLTAAAG